MRKYNSSQIISRCVREIAIVVRTWYYGLTLWINTPVVSFASVTSNTGTQNVRNFRGNLIQTIEGATGNKEVGNESLIMMGNFTFQTITTREGIIQQFVVLVKDSVHTAAPPDEYELFYLDARFYTGLVAYPIVGVLGLLGSILCVVVMSQPQMASSTNTYLMALAISDTVKVVSDLLYFLVVLLFHFNTEIGTRAYNFVYPYAHYVFNASMCISAWLTVSVSMERYIYVCHPTKVKAYCSIRRARAISMSVFLIMSVIAIPYAFRYHSIESFDNTTSTVIHSLNVTDLWRNTYFSEIFTWTQFLLRSVLPLLFLIILNCCIICGIRHCRFIGRAIGARKHRITFMLFAVVAVFLVCTSPDTIMSSIFSVGYYEEDYLRRGIREITDLLLLLNATINFVLYCIFNTVFWQSFTRLFCRTCRKEDNSALIFHGRTGNVSQRLSLLPASNAGKRRDGGGV